MTSSRLYKKLEQIRSKRGGVAIALIDPDKKNDLILNKMLELINKADFDVIFVGGSKISDDKFNYRIKKIKNKTSKPVIIFPGSSKQISKFADGILYISLISGRNPEYLIGEHVKSSTIVKKYSLEVLPTAYILINGGSISSVEKISKTAPLDPSDLESIIKHALAGQYLGNSFIFLEAGSGAEKHISEKIINSLKEKIDIPIIVGGGIKSEKSAKKLINAGAGYIVIGNKLESLPEPKEISAITEAIHIYN